MAPHETAQDVQFYKIKGLSFSEFLLSTTPPELIIKEYDTVRVITPMYLEKPFGAVILAKQKKKKSLSPSGSNEDLAMAISDMTNSLSEIMGERGMEFAYNLVFHTDYIGPMYVELLPCTQITAGFEKAGVGICQSSPLASTNVYKGKLKEG